MNKHATDNGSAGGTAVAALAREACRLQLTSSGRGVISVRHSGNGSIMITAGGARLEDIDAGNILVVNRDGEIVGGDAGRSAPEELDLHLRVYQDRADVNVLAHLYPPHASAFADRGELFEISDQAARREIGEFIRVICRECPSRFTGLCSCWNDIRHSATGAGALLVKEDGIVVLAADFDTAFKRLELLEQTAREAAG